MARLLALVALVLIGITSVAADFLQLLDKYQELERERELLRRESVGGDSTGQPPGVPLIANTTFAGNDSLPSSPLYYPTPNATARGRWADPIRRAREEIDNWTLEEQVNLVTGVGWEAGPCVGNIASNANHSFPGLCLEDSPLGVRYADLVNVFPAGITTAATWDKGLAYQRGFAMGQEHRAKGVNVALGPGMNFLRSAAAGRNWEMGGADPYLLGEAAHHTVRGIQDAGVQATAKHYIGNDQEHYRTSSSSNIDDRTMREIYLHPFMRSVQADVAAVMCSYNLINNTYSCQNSYLLNSVLKTELGFEGYVVSDWGAQYSGVPTAIGGLDMTQPGQDSCCTKGLASFFWGQNLTTAVNNGSVEASRVRDMGVRILAAWYLLGQDAEDYPAPNFNAFDLGDPINQHINVNKLFKHGPIIRQIAAAGSVLVKNNKSRTAIRGLPLKRLSGHTPNKIAIIGSDAGPARMGPNYFADRGGVDGTLGEGWGSGSADYSIFISPLESLQARAAEEGIGFDWTFEDYDYAQAAKIANASTGTDAAIVFLQSDSGEGYITVDGNIGDRQNLTAWHDGDTLVQTVAAVQNNTIVVLHHPAQIDVEAWIEHPNVTAVIFAHMPGRESGPAITDILFGDVVPSGRLPYTVAKNRTDYGTDVTYVNVSTSAYVQVNYTEGLSVDYRHFDAKNITPRFEFGHGLSYTDFTFSNLSGHWLNNSHWDDDSWNQRPHTEGLPSELFEDVYEYQFDLMNVGSRAAYEVPQAYLSFPASSGEPPKVLRNFDRVWLEACVEHPENTRTTVTWRLSRYDLSIWDNVTRKWIRPDGQVELLVGKSSRKIELTMEL